MNTLIFCDLGGLETYFSLRIPCFWQSIIEGRLVYIPIVGHLNCVSTYVDHQGYWETAGYGLLSVYKSDWIRFGGKRNN